MSLPLPPVPPIPGHQDPRGAPAPAVPRAHSRRSRRPRAPLPRAVPARGKIALLLSAWYSKPLLDRAYGASTKDLEIALDEIIGFERLLTDDGTAILKIWLHLGKAEQEKRFRRLEKDELQKWRVTETDWKHWKMYDRFVAAAERIISRSSTGAAPWHIVEGVDSRYASLHVADLLLQTIESQLDQRWHHERRPQSPDSGSSVRDVGKLTLSDARPARASTILSTLDMSHVLSKKKYKELIATQQGRLHDLQRAAVQRGIASVIVFEGWDAAGKGGTIRRINAAVDSRTVTVIQVGMPTDEERAHHYLWRFWRHIPRQGRMAIFDRSWYGRVLVERVHGFATEEEWHRAYAEINLFEQQLVEHGIVMLKFFLHITPEEQLRRFHERENTPYKQWKITDEDWRNRDRWDDYELAVHDVVERTSTQSTPWTLVEANDKRYARVTILEHICTVLSDRLGAGADKTARPRTNKRKGHKN